MTVTILHLLFILSMLNQRGLSSCADDYPIEHEIRTLDAEKFTIDGLRQYFSKYLEYAAIGELTVRVTSDEELARYLETPKVRVHSAHEKLPADHTYLKTLGPQACLYKIGANFFFEYRDLENHIGWETLGGENILNQSFGSTKAHYVGQYWERKANEKPALWKRNLVLVMPTLDKMSPTAILNILSSYDNLLACPNSLKIEIYQSFHQPDAIKFIAFPSYEAIAKALPNSQEGIGKRVFYSRDDRNSTPRIFRIYDGKRLVFSNTK